MLNQLRGVRVLGGPALTADSTSLLSSDDPRSILLGMGWPPESEEALQLALNEGVLGESAHLDVKREPPPPGKKNANLAIDMACMAVEGGVLIFGVDEAKQELRPFPYGGFRERIDLIARTLIDEPLTVRVIEIPSSAEALGFVVVVIPPSPTAPHLVEGRYRGRGDTTNRTLTDSEVVRLHERRRVWEGSAEALLDTAIARDPTEAEDRSEAHLFVIAEPVGAAPELLLERIEQDWKTWLHKTFMRTAGQPLSKQWAPDLAAPQASRRANGWALHSGRVQSDRSLTENYDETDLLDLEIGEGGQLSLYCGRASETHSSLGPVLFESIIAGLTMRIVLGSRAISEETAFYGSWDFGMAVTNARGRIPYGPTQRFPSAYSNPYSEESYRQVTRSTYEELSRYPATVVNRLCGRMLRGLGTGESSIPVPLANASE